MLPFRILILHTLHANLFFSVSMAETTVALCNRYVSIA